MGNVAHAQNLIHSLREQGGIHATGLPYHCCVTGENGIFEPNSNDLGKYFYDGYWNYIVLPEEEGGEIWLLYGEPNTETIMLFRKLCPGRQMAFSPYPHAVEVSGMALAARIKNPHDKQFGDPIPHIQHREVIGLHLAEALSWSV